MNNCTITPLRGSEIKKTIDSHDLSLFSLQCIFIHDFSIFQSRLENPDLTANVCSGLRVVVERKTRRLHHRTAITCGLEKVQNIDVSPGVPKSSNAVRTPSNVEHVSPSAQTCRIRSSGSRRRFLGPQATLRNPDLGHGTSITTCRHSCEADGLHSARTKVFAVHLESLSRAYTVGGLGNHENPSFLSNLPCKYVAFLEKY